MTTLYPASNKAKAVKDPMYPVPLHVRFALVRNIRCDVTGEKLSPSHEHRT